MLRRNIKLLTVLIVVSLVVGVSIFYACKKEESIPIVNNTDIPENPAKDYNAHIEELIAMTGIDIYDLSTLGEIRKIADAQRNIMNKLIEPSLTKGEFTEEKLAQMEVLLAAINAASSDSEILSLYQSFCNICATIDYFHINENGIPIFVFDPNAFSQNTSVAVELIKEIENSCLSFPSLPPDIQIEIIAAAIYLNMQNSESKKPSYEDCKNEALRMYAVTASLATASLQAGLISCAASGPGAPACCATAGAIYGVAMGVGYWQYRRAIKRC